MSGRIFLPIRTVQTYTKDPSLIPNARRDDFERNDAYYLVVEQLRKLANDIVKPLAFFC